MNPLHYRIRYKKKIPFLSSTLEREINNQHHLYIIIKKTVTSQILYNPRNPIQSNELFFDRDFEPFQRIIKMSMDSELRDDLSVHPRHDRILILARTCQRTHVVGIHDLRFRARVQDRRVRTLIICVSF